MSSERFKLPEVALPDGGRVQALGSEVLKALAAARDRLQRDMTELLEARQRLEVDERAAAENQEHAARLRRDWEAKQADLERVSGDLANQRQEIAGWRKEIDAERKSLSTQLNETKAREAKLREQQEAQSASAKALAEREHALARAEQQMEARVKELKGQEADLRRREMQCAARVQELETEREAVASARSALAAMQEQLDRDHRAVAVQREELLQCLDSVPKPVPGESDDRSGAGPTESDRSEWRGAPKPAAGNVDQFRKLRRDAKRKAIGV